MKRFRMMINWVFAAVLILMLIAAFTVEDNTTFKNPEFETDLSDGWYMSGPEAGGEAVTFPYDFPDGSDTLQITRTLPQVFDHHILLIKCNYNAMWATVDGEEIYHSLPATVGLVETDLGHYTAMIPLDQSYSGKEIVLTIQERESGYSSDVREISLTSTGQFGLQRLQEKLVTVIVSVVILICAVLALGVWLVLWIRNGSIPEESYHPLLWIGLFATSLGVWVATEAHLVAIVTGAFATSGILNYFALSLLPVSLLGLLKSICTEKLRSLQYIVICAKLCLLIQLLLFLTGLVDLSGILILLQGACILAMLIFLFYMVWKRNCFAFGPAIRYGSGFVLVMLVCAIVNYVWDGDWMFYALAGVVSILVSVVIATLTNVYKLINNLSQTERYKEFALTDIMTGLKSRYAYTIFEAKYKIGALPEDLCLIFMDINKLKTANDTLGHVAGDEMIIATSKCIKEAFGDSAECFRMGGDEFLVAMSADKQTANRRIERLNELLSHWEGKYVDSLTVSYGMAFARENPGMDYETLLKTADREMYQYKKQCGLYH